MESKTQEFGQGLRQAMLAEQAGRDFYSLTAEKTRHPGGRRILELLAAEEAGHYEYLRRHYESVIATGELARGLTLGEAHQLATCHPILTPDLLAGLRHVRFEADAIEIAVQLERNSVDHYLHMAEGARTPEVKALFAQLAAWESEHHDAFLQLRSELAAAEKARVTEAR